jgi:uncharacterized protein (TIGR03905 family)
MIYETTGVCPLQTLFDIKGETIGFLEFINGCDGSLQGILKLTEGIKFKKIIKKSERIRCTAHKLSCPNQLANTNFKGIGNTFI